MKLLIFQLPSLAAIICAFLLLMKGVSGWGWFLFIAVLLSASKA
ncbi:hypothetical protein [Rodentibacter trehalosifermentans]|nr:hypothetical protein [Rodentibacter trehalosifermentans]